MKILFVAFLLLGIICLVLGLFTAGAVCTLLAVILAAIDICGTTFTPKSDSRFSESDLKI
jgi:uncharacterized membrane protein